VDRRLARSLRRLGRQHLVAVDLNPGVIRDVEIPLTLQAPIRNQRSARRAQDPEIVGAAEGTAPWLVHGGAIR
jgi:hypothetical protein